MSKREHRIYFSSRFSEVDSNFTRFTVNLPLPLELQGNWKCAIRDFFVTNRPVLKYDYFYIIGDFCETSLIHQKEQLPVLAKVFLNKKKHYILEDRFYIPLKQNLINSFELQFLNSDLKPLKLEGDYTIECTLHFLKYD